MTPQRLILLACLFIAPGIGAEEFVVMKNGDRVTGDVKQIWNGEVFIEPEYGDEYAIDLDYVEYVQSDEELEVEVLDAGRIDKVIGRLGQSESGEAAVIDASGEMLYPLSQVDNVQEIEDYFDWELRSDLSINVSEGNTDASSSRLGVYLDVTLGDHDHQLTFTRDEQRTDDELTKDQTRALYRDSWTFADHWFLRGAIEWTRDPIRQLDYRTQAFAGLGYHFYDDSKRRLNLSAGPAWVAEKIGGETERSRAVGLALNYEQKFFGDDLVLFQTTSYTRIYDGRENELFDFAAGFRYDITDDIYASLQGTYGYESNPAADQEQVDFTYLMGLGIELD
jgi:putative salt-induced outer membrane protein YdiY